MSTIIDRRHEKSDKSSGNRRRLKRKYKDQIKEAAERAIADRGIENLDSGGIDVNIPKRDLSQPIIHHGGGGDSDIVLPGNKDFTPGDYIEKPKGGGGGGGQGQAQGDEASNDGEGNDDFVFHLSEDEFLDYLFTDLELPNLHKKADTGFTEVKYKRAGRVSEGPYEKLDLVESKKKRMMRLRAQTGPIVREIIELLSEKLAVYANYSDVDVAMAQKAMKQKKPLKGIVKNMTNLLDKLSKAHDENLSDEDASALSKIDERLDVLQEKKGRIPSWDTSTDLKFAFHKPEPIPVSKAVMFCMMDVSMSMDQETKNTAKIFYYLLYKFLKRQYDNIDIVFIRHHTTAKEVDEQEFFYGTDTGGTVVSTALEEMIRIQNERYSDGSWNTYAAQATDGDNWGDDNDVCHNLLTTKILPETEGYFYIEIPRMPGHHQKMWEMFETIQASHSDQFWMAEVNERADVPKVFRKFFAKDNIANAPKSRAPQPS